MSVIYTHLTYEHYKRLEEQMRQFAETAHRTEGGFYHKSIRLKVSDDLIMEFHGPMVGGYGHNQPPAVSAMIDAGEAAACRADAGRVCSAYTGASKLGGNNEGQEDDHEAVGKVAAG